MDTKSAAVFLKPDSICSLCQNHKAVNKAQLSFGGQFKEFFAKLFDTHDWPSRWHCGTWTDFHGWLYIISDLFIWAAYFAIPILLYRIVLKRKDIPFLKVFWLFIAFILLCGLTHLVDAGMFWWPVYRISASVRFATAVVSVFTVFALYKIVPLINNLRTVEQLEFQIEERKRAEQIVQQQQLQQQATEELMRKKDEFMSIASHELKTPITSVKASLQIVERLVKKHKELEPVSPLVEKAGNQVNKLTGIINDLLDVTRIQAGKLQLNITEFSLPGLISESVEQCQILDKRHKVTVKGDPQITVSADRNRVEQVLSNLINNAIKYSPESEELMITYDRQGDNSAKVSVTDYGIGISEEQVDNIFDRFFRVEHTSQNYSGLGLGLYISSEIIKQHKGKIGVESAIGKGSTFWFTLMG